MSNEDIESIINNPIALAELIYSKSNAKNAEEDPVEKAKKQIELLSIGRQIRKHSNTIKE